MSDEQDHSDHHTGAPIDKPQLVNNSAHSTPPSTDSPEQHQKNAENAVARENQGWLEWKKEIKHFFKALRKFGDHKHYEGKQAWLMIALKLLDFSPRPRNSQNFGSPSGKNKIQRKEITNSKIITIINKTPKPQSFLLLILSYRCLSSKQQQIYFDLELISKTSRIIYKKINLRKWQQIHREIERARSQTSNLILMLQDKRSLMPHIDKNKELLHLFESFQELQMSPLKQETETTKKNACKLQDIKDAELIYQVIERFQFIRGALLRTLQRDSYASLTVNETLAVTIAYNIISLLPVSHHRPLSTQMKPFFTAIMRNMNREHDKQQRRYKSVALNQDHFPVHLQNAQNCWRCKKKRGYVCCSTCTRSEGRNISLCLNCYANHHSELNNSVVSHSEQEAAAIFQQWSTLNCVVESMIPEVSLSGIVKVEEPL